LPTGVQRFSLGTALIFQKEKDREQDTCSLTPPLEPTEGPKDRKRGPSPLLTSSRSCCGKRFCQGPKISHAFRPARRDLRKHGGDSGSVRHRGSSKSTSRKSLAPDSWPRGTRLDSDDHDAEGCLVFVNGKQGEAIAGRQRSEVCAAVPHRESLPWIDMNARNLTLSLIFFFCAFQEGSERCRCWAQPFG
jgi:hypothetical protein